MLPRSYHAWGVERLEGDREMGGGATVHLIRHADLSPRYIYGRPHVTAIHQVTCPLDSGGRQSLVAARAPRQVSGDSELPL